MSEENVHEDIINEENPITNQREPEQVEIEQPSTGTESIPDRYQGKSVEEIIEMHRNAEAALSRQGNELGETRKLIDHILQTTPSPQQKDPEPVQYDWDYEPDKAAQDLVSKEVGAVKKELDEMKRQTAIEKFKSKFPNFDSDSTSPEFIDWVQKSEYRTNLYNRNYNGVDLDAATELMLAWQDSKPVADDSKRQEALKAASMEKGASSGGSRKKMWSRAYIRKLLKTDMATYKANYDEIMAAYQEGRIKP